MTTNTNAAIYKTLTISQDGPVARITINRPETLNALNAAVLEEMDRFITQEMDSAKTRVLIIEGAGDKAFVAGADISAMQNMTPGDARHFARRGQMLTKTLESIPQVTIAKVQGFALGGGCELAMACDIIVAGRNARFGQPEVNLGIIPGFGGTQRLVRRVGLHVGLDMLLTGRGRTLSGDEAFQLGLVSRVVDDAKLSEEVDKVVKAILKVGPRAAAETKRLAREAYAMSLEAGLNAEANTFAACFGDDEAREGIKAFVEKRPAAFSS